MFELGKKLAESLIEYPKQHRIDAVFGDALFRANVGFGLGEFVWERISGAKSSLQCGVGWKAKNRKKV